MPRLPIPITDELRLADWLELAALTSPDDNASSGDLERALHRSAALDAGAEQQAIEQSCLATFAELEGRALAADQSYPFVVDGSVLRTRDGAENTFLVYTFCLCLSALGTKAAKRRKFFPHRVFERLCCSAAGNYVGGQSLRFASPRDDLPRPFKKAIVALCVCTGEGDGFREQPTQRSQDDTLDIVAWKHFIDRQPGKIVMFGQCAGGLNWTQKLGELDPHYFCDQWMRESPVSEVVKAFFVPHRIRRDYWKRINRKAGIVFDRCRIANLADLSTISGRGEVLKWTRKALRAFRSGTASFQ